MAAPDCTKFIKALQKNKIPVWTPGQDAYEHSVATSNLFYRYSRPDCVALPESRYHVQAVVQEALKHRVPITIKNGGHSYAGFSTTNAGVSLDLRRMNAVEYDPAARTITCDAGALWGHAYKELINGRHDGLMINGGRCPTVGVSGFVLGGGLGPFTRSLGMGCDSLLEATLVTARGAMVTVSAADDPASPEGQLFWALRGAGGGNFGVVVELKLRVHALAATHVVAGKYVWSPDAAAMDGFAAAMHGFYTKAWPPTLTIDSSWLCDLAQTKSELQVRFLVYFDGEREAFAEIMNRSKLPDPLRQSLLARFLPEASTRFLHETLVDLWYEETLRAFPANKGFHIYSSFSFPNEPAIIQSLVRVLRAEMQRFRQAFDGEKGLMQVTWIHAGGKAAEPAADATAFRWRDCVYHAYVTFEWTDKWLEQPMRAFLVAFKQTLLTQVFQKDLALFVNFPDDRLDPDVHERAYYGDNYQRLRAVKQMWDPADFFHPEQGVRLPSAPIANPKRAIDMMIPETEFTDQLVSDRWKTFVVQPVQTVQPVQPVQPVDAQPAVAGNAFQAIQSMF